MATTTMTGEVVLTQRQLNRALLARQHLLARSDVGVTDMIEALVGMQSQEPNAPYTGLWSRLQAFQPAVLSTLLLERSAVRASLMRGTIHLVTADDYRVLFPLTLPLHERRFPGLDHGRKLDLTLLPDIVAAGREALSHGPLTAKAIGDRLGPQFTGQPPDALAQAIRFLLPLVQITPRGVWGQSKQATWALAEEWLGTPIPKVSRSETMIERYLAAFGPATVADAQAWSGLTGLRSVFDTMRPRLRVFRNESGQELFDIPDGALPDPDTPAPVRLLPGFENALLSHKDRTRIISEERRKAIGSNNGLFQATYLVDGMVTGTWMMETSPDCVTMVVTPFEQHNGATLDALEDEAWGLLCMLGEGKERAVRFNNPLTPGEFAHRYR